MYNLVFPTPLSPADQTAYLAVANYVGVEMFDLSSARHRTIIGSNIPRTPVTPEIKVPGKKVTMLDVNVHNKTVCYVGIFWKIFYFSFHSKLK